MTKTTWPKAALYLVTALLATPFAKAELVQSRVSDQSVAPSSANEIQLANGGDSDTDEVVVVHQKPKKRRVVVLDEGDESAPVAAAPQAKNSVGSAVDTTIDKKLDDARGRMEQRLADAIDKMQINVGDQNQAAQAAPQTVVVQDQTVQKAAANEKISAELPKEVAVSESEKKDSELKGAVAISPIFGLTSLSSDKYNIDSKYTAGIGLEVDISDNFSFTTSYRYSQFDVSLANANPLYGYYSGYNTGYLNSAQTLTYNQNVIDATGRFYILPKNYRFRFFLGAGIGYNKGYLNYNQQTIKAYNNNAYYASSGLLDDYEVTSTLGILETGGELQLSHSFALGMDFKYQSILSSSENQPLNNNGFVPYNTVAPTDKSVIGGSLRDNSFYSLLGSIKYSF